MLEVKELTLGFFPALRNHEIIACNADYWYLPKLHTLTYIYVG